MTTHEFTVDGSTVALWHMNGTVGSAGKLDNAEGTATYDLTELNSPTSATGFNGTADGAYQSSTSAGGSGTYNLESANNAALNPANLTVELWFKMGEANKTLILQPGSGGGGASYYIEQTSGNLVFAIGLSGSTPSVSTAFSNTTNWHYAVLTHDGVTLTGYLDGASVGSVSAASRLTQNATLKMMSRDSGGSNHLLMDEVRISNTIRTAQEISDYYNAINRIDTTDNAVATDTTTLTRMMLIDATENATATDTNLLAGILKVDNAVASDSATITTGTGWTNQEKSSDTGWTNQTISHS